MSSPVEAVVKDLSGRATTVLALEAVRRLVPLLYEQEEYVDAKLVEVPCEEALGFFAEEKAVFQRVYGHADALVFRLQEVAGRAHLESALQATLHALLAACLRIHAHHADLEGGEGPGFDCYLAEASAGDAVTSLVFARKAERELISLLGPSTNTYDRFDDWAPVAVAELKEQGDDVRGWVLRQPTLPIPYPFRQKG